MKFVDIVRFCLKSYKKRTPYTKKYATLWYLAVTGLYNWECTALCEVRAEAGEAAKHRAHKFLVSMSMTHQKLISELMTSG